MNNLSPWRAVLVICLFCQLSGSAFGATFLPTADELKNFDFGNRSLARTEPTIDLNQLPRGYDGQRSYVIVDDMAFDASTIRPSGAASGNLWSSGNVYYVFDPAIAIENRAAWRIAATFWSAVANLRFIEGTGNGNYISIQNSTGNSSYVGMIGGQQIMNLQSWNTFVIAHEIGHALGLIHEQSRGDRNSYVIILPANILSGQAHNFDIWPAPATIYGAYDFDSLMHYRKRAFSSNGLNTIEPLPAYFGYLDTMGQQTHLSQLDQSAMAQRYGNVVQPTPTPTPGPTGPVRFGNIATRMRVDTGSSVMIGGFIVTGNAPKNIVVRGIGPSLAAFGVSGVLAEPVLELRAANGSLIAQNDNWQDNPSQAAQLGALGFALQDPRESAVMATLQPGSYTAILSGRNQTAGVGLVEIYDTNSAADAQMANISTRGSVLTGNDVMIGGFILGGSAGSTRVVVRGIGPSLAEFGLNPVLSDPTLELRNTDGALLMENDDWQNDSIQAGQLTAADLAPASRLESALVATLPPGSYTAILAGWQNATGIGLIEIYNVH